MKYIAQAAKDIDAAACFVAEADKFVDSGAEFACLTLLKEEFSQHDLEQALQQVRAMVSSRYREGLAAFQQWVQYGLLPQFEEIC